MNMSVKHHSYHSNHHQTKCFQQFSQNVFDFNHWAIRHHYIFICIKCMWILDIQYGYVLDVLGCLNKNDNRTRILDSLYAFVIWKSCSFYMCIFHLLKSVAWIFDIQITVIFWIINWLTRQKPRVECMKNRLFEARNPGPGNIHSFPSFIFKYTLKCTIVFRISQYISLKAFGNG